MDTDQNMGIESLLKGICTSKLRTNILLSLEKPMTLAELKNTIYADSPNASSSARELEDLGLVTRKSGYYSLTSFGSIVRSKLNEFQDLLTTFNNHGNWWQTHNFDVIPIQFKKNIHVFSDAQIIQDSKIEAGKAYAKKMELMKKAKKRIKGIILVYSQEAIEIVINRAKQGASCQFIVAPDIAAYMGKAENIQQMKALLENMNVQMKVADVHFMFLLIDDSLVLALSHLDNPDHFDWSAMLFSSNPEAVRWGEELFDFYWKKTKPMKVEDLKKSPKTKTKK